MTAALEGSAYRSGPERARAWLDRAIGAQRGRLFHWAPVFLTCGIWIYFGLAREPSGIAVMAVVLLGLALLWLGRSIPVLVLVSLVVLGFGLAKLRSDIVATPLLHATTSEVQVSGLVTGVKTTGSRRFMVLLAPDAVEGLTTDRTPRLLRLTGFDKLGVPRIGQRVALKARLSPLPSPVEPGGFDYGRRLWFESVGGTGRIVAPLDILNGDIPWRYRPAAFIAGLRQAMGQRIRASLDGTLASFAEALITGERSAIPKEINHSLLVSGLFHILSISGLHMWLVAGGVFWGLRAALALIPRLALRYPIKKWAAGSAILMGLFYMLLADSGVATQRSFIMIAVVFFAVIADRPALSTRNLALAAIAVLLLEPEAAIEASFQMSFLAVLGIVSFAELWNDYRGKSAEPHVQPHGFMRRAGGRLAIAVFLALVTSLIASTMSSIPAAYHFGRLAPYGLIANGLALPVIGFVVMPMALLAALLMPLGLEAAPLFVMGEGLKLVMLISDRVAALPGAYVIVAQPPPGAVLLLAGAAAGFCLLAGTLRLAMLPVIGVALGLLLAPVRTADILVERSGANAAIRNSQGEWIPAWPRRSRFTVEKWLQTNGEEVSPALAAKRPGWTCTDLRCDGTVKGKRVALVSGDGTASLDCSGLDILIADFPLRGTCKAVPTRIDRFDLWRKGAHGLRIDGDAVTVSTARQVQGERPWTVIPEARKDRFKRPVDRGSSTHSPAPLSGATASP